MKKLFLKKCFFDGWDNLLALFLNNLVFMPLIAGVFFAKSILMETLLLAIASFHYLGVNGAAFYITRSTGKWYQGYVKAIKKTGHFFVFFLVAFLMVVSVLYIVPIYFSFGDVVRDAIGFFYLFVVLFLLLTMVYYYPLAMALENDGPVKTLKKCFLVFYDNLGFSVYCTFKDIFDLVISVFTAFLIPGFSGIAVNRTTAVYFFLKKYDYMEENKVGKKYAFADRYLADIDEEYQDRNLSTLFMPWKR